MLHVEQHDAQRPTIGRDVVTRDGWPIMDELAALNDRLDHIDPDRPAPDDLTDLARWVHHKMTTPAPTANLACPLPQLLRTQAAQHPDAPDRLATILELRRNTDRSSVHRLAQLALAIVLIITAKLIDWHVRWNRP